MTESTEGKILSAKALHVFLETLMQQPAYYHPPVLDKESLDMCITYADSPTFLVFKVYCDKLETHEALQSLSYCGK